MNPLASTDVEHARKFRDCPSVVLSKQEITTAKADSQSSSNSICRAQNSRLSFLSQGLENPISIPNNVYTLKQLAVAEQ